MMPVRSPLKSHSTRPAGLPCRRLPGRLVVAGAFLALLPVGLAQPQNMLVWRTNYYSITGATLGEIHRSMEQSRPWKDSEYRTGLTEWRIDWRFEVKPGGDGCRCSAFNTTTTITNILPRWTPPTEAPAEVKAAWGRYIQALGMHEAGHSRAALAAAADLQQRIKQLGPAADCEELRKRINSLADRVIDEHRQRERDYDQRTRHGATQGAALR